MALPARQPIQDENDGLGKAAANDNFEIKNVNVAGGSNAKIEGKKIKLEINLPKNKAANDNVEIDQTPNTNISASAPEAKKPTDTASDITDKAPATPPTITPTTPPTESAPNKPKTNNQSQNINQTPDRSNQSQPPQPNNQAPIENEPQTPLNPEENRIPQEQENELPQPEDAQPIADQQTPPNNQQTPQSDQPQNEKTPPLSGAEPKPWRSDANPNADKRLPQQTNTPTNDELSNTGPHSASDKTPKTIPPQNQAKASSDMSSAKHGGGVIQSGKNALQNTANKVVDGTKNGIKNKINNIAQSLQSDRSRKIQLGRQRRKLESELRFLENKMDGVNASKYMRIIRFWFPGIYAAISGLGSGMSNAKGEAKVALLSSKLISAQTIKGTLKATEGVSALVEANIKAISWIAESIETVIIPILLILVYPIIIIILWIYIEFMGAMNAPITKSIKELVKEVDQIIESLEKVLKPEKEKLKKRREIQVINRLMAASSQDRKMHLQQQKEQEDYERSQNSNNNVTN